MRRIPLNRDANSKLYSKDKKSGTSAADDILKFCAEPRTRSEICAMMGKSAEWWVRRGYINPLLESGRLLMTIPDKPTSPDNKFVTTEYSTAVIASPEGLLEYCKIPRRKREIYLHFGLSAFQMKSIFDPLMADGRLICTDPTNPKNHWQKFVTAESENATIRLDAVSEFCKEPRSREALAEFLGTTDKFVKRYIDYYLTEGIIRMTKPDAPKSIDQRFVAVDTDTAILTADAVAEFCRMPKSRLEIAAQFSLLIHNARKYIDKLVDEGKLKMTIPLVPSAKQQRYMHPETEFNELSLEALLEYLRIPRTKDEIVEHFNFSTKMGLSHYLYPLLDSGVITYTIPQCKSHKQQKFVTV